MRDRVFKAQNYYIPTYKHVSLPVYQTYEFDFFRCVQFDERFYGKTVSELHRGNLRTCTGRYSKLFPNQKLSYWADSRKTAIAEVKKHGAKNDLLTFWAYDDASSFIPTVDNLECLTIIDGRKCGVQDLINKIDNNEMISEKDQRLLEEIMACRPDCLAYDSKAMAGGENFIFFEKGFYKLSLRSVRLRLGNTKKRYAEIGCAVTSDYVPFLEGYGEYFLPILRKGQHKEYFQSEEYLSRKSNYKKYLKEKLNEIG